MAAAMLCSVVLLALCLLVSMALMAGYYYGPVELVAGPGVSRLVRANPIFIKEITVRMAEGEGEQGSEKNGLVLYGLAGGAPRLDVPAAWSQARRVVVPTNSHRAMCLSEQCLYSVPFSLLVKMEWVYFLNRGSQIQVDYRVEHGAELINPLCIVIAQGKESFTQTENPSVYDTTACRLVHGTGTVKQDINSSGDYYVAVGNLHEQDTAVILDIRVSAVLYDTSGADYACSPGSSHRCTYTLPILGKNAAVLSSAVVKERPSSEPADEQYVRVVLSYEPRWLVYFVVSAILAVALLLLYEVLSTMLAFCCCCCCTGGEGGRRSAGAGEQRTTTASLLENKEEEASLGSSYDSVSHDGDEDEDGGDEEEGRRLCVVCCDARRDCFFLPCGHSATCHPCGTRIVEGDGGSCPFCRRKLKKVRRIFAV